MQLLGDVWTLKIIYTLLTGTRRFGEILGTMGNVSPKTVSNRLKMLEEIKFVQRMVAIERPVQKEKMKVSHLLAIIRAGNGGSRKFEEDKVS
ncbi:MAG: winged helix-turn-helix transcriptional regulator [Ktedonobacteraceae bacterium]